MTLKQTLQKDIITAMKAKDKATANTLRMVSAALTKQEQAKGQKGDLTVDQELQILNKELKSRHEELEAFNSVNNQEKVDQIASEIEIIKSYQPRQLSDDELKKLAAELKKRCGCGGSVKDGNIEIQGEKRDLLKQLLEQKGFKVKLAGG